MSEPHLKFSGTKTVYGSGATRDKRIGKGRFDLISPLALRRLALIYEGGAINHGARNWAKGIPIGDCLCSAIRHINQNLEGLRDEDHLAQAAWNLFAAMHYETLIERNRLSQELDNRPNMLAANKNNDIFQSAAAGIPSGGKPG